MIHEYRTGVKVDVLWMTSWLFSPPTSILLLQIVISLRFNFDYSGRIIPKCAVDQDEKGARFVAFLISHRWLALECLDSLVATARCGRIWSLQL